MLAAILSSDASMVATLSAGLVLASASRVVCAGGARVVKAS